LTGVNELHAGVDTGTHIARECDEIGEALGFSRAVYPVKIFVAWGDGVLVRRGGTRHVSLRMRWLNHTTRCKTGGRKMTRFADRRIRKPAGRSLPTTSAHKGTTWYRRKKPPGRRLSAVCTPSCKTRSPLYSGTVAVLA